MALSEARRASLLAYCRIEEPTAEELLTLEGLYDAAVGYLEQAGVSEPEGMNSSLTQAKIWHGFPLFSVAIPKQGCYNGSKQ